MSKVRARGILATVCLSLLIVALPPLVLSMWPNLTSPASIGTDPSNYLAAGQRLDAGHDLYALQPGDRPVANGTRPSEWKYPLLSPPPIAVVWRVLALLPGDSSMYLWWLAGAIALGAFTLWLIARCTPRGLALLMLLLISATIEIMSGNVNAFLIPAVAVVWPLSMRGRSGAAGAVVGAATLLKLMPGIFVWWFFVRQDWGALRSAAATLAVGLAISVLGAGLSAHLQYIDVAREANSVALLPTSPVLVAQGLGAPEPLARLVPYAIAGAAALLVLAWRRSPAISFILCVIGLTFGTPDLRFDALAWLMVAMVPWANERQPLDGILDRLRLVWTRREPLKTKSLTQV